MKALLDRDKKVQIEALKGLIKASEVLGLDPTRYENALKAVAPRQKVRKESGKRTKSSAKKSASIEKYPSSKTSKRAMLLRSEIEEGRLVLIFDRRVDRESIKHFILERKGRVLYVYDFKNAKIPFSIKRYRGAGFKEIRIAQFDPKRVRVVIETLKAYKPKLTAADKTVAITLPGYSKKRRGGAKKASPESSSAKTSSAVFGARFGKKSYTVVVDPGHGGKDAGAVGYKKRREKDAVLAVAKRLKRVLEKRGFRVYLTRSRDVFIPLKKRTKFANRKNADFFISIHANAAPKGGSRYKSKGIETYFLSWSRSGRAKRVAELENRADFSNKNFYTKNTYLNSLNREKIIESNKLAIDLQRQILASLKKKYRGVVDNGVRDGPFWVLVGAQMPAVLIEIGYITHPTEGPRLFNPNYQNLLAEGIANGIESYIYHSR